MTLKKRQHYFFGTKNDVQRSNSELFFSDDKGEAWKQQDSQQDELEKQ